MIDIEAIRKSTRLVKRLPTAIVSQAQRNVIALLEEIDQLRGNLSLAEEGLASYEQENARLRKALEDVLHQGEPDSLAVDIVREALESLPTPQSGNDSAT